MTINRELIIATVKENVSLSVFDVATGEIVAAVTVGTRDIAKPHEIAVTVDGGASIWDVAARYCVGPS